MNELVSRWTSLLVLVAAIAGCSSKTEPEVGGAEPVKVENKTAAAAPDTTPAPEATAPAPKPAAAAGIFDTRFVYPGFAAAVIFNPQRIYEAPIVKALPKDDSEQLEKRLSREMPFNPRDLERVVSLIGPPAQDGDLGVPVTAGVILIFSNPPDQNALAKKILFEYDPVDEAGQKFFRGKRKLGAPAMAPAIGREEEGRKSIEAELKPYSSLCLAFVEPTVAVMAPEKCFKKMLAAKQGTGPLAELLATVDPQHAVVAVGVMAPVKELLSAVAEGARQQAPPPLRMMASFPDHLKSAVLTADLDGEYLLKLDMVGNDEDGANTLESYGIVGRDLAKSGLAAVRPEIEKNLPPDAAQPILKLLDDLLAGFKVKSDGANVAVSVKTPPGFSDLPKTLAPAIEEARNKAREAARANSLRHLGIAMHIHHDSFQSFPPAAFSNDGKPHLSWRVKILPYIEQMHLYEQFRHDEPWDSEHNRALIGKMPLLYGLDKEKGLTSVFVFTGPNTMFSEGKGTTISRITDGTSNTILLVEAAPDKAVPWTKPEDLSVDENNPAAALGRLPGGKFWAVFADGSIRKLDAGMKAAELLALIQPADGKPASVDEPANGPAPTPPSESGVKRAFEHPQESEPAEPPADAPVAAEPRFRTWTTADGKHTVEAELLGIEGDNVRLKKRADGKEITVPLSRFSQQDQDYARQHATP